LAATGFESVAFAESLAPFSLVALPAEEESAESAAAEDPSDEESLEEDEPSAAAVSRWRLRVP